MEDIDVSDPRPASAAEAVARALSIIGKGGQYALATGDYRPVTVGGHLVDLPWTAREKDGLIGSDCAGFAICWCYKLRRHRPGFNRGGDFDCEDDINNNSVLGDAMGAMDCFQVVQDLPQPGDLLSYPTFRLAGVPQPFIGHVGICVGVDRVDIDAWDLNEPRFDQLDVAQCHGPDKFTPGVVQTDGSIWLRHNHDWPKPQHRAYLIRALP